MDDDHIIFPEYSQDDLDQVIEGALAAAKRLHTKITTLAEDTGYMVHVISAAQPQLNGLYEQAKTDPSVYPIVASGIDYLRSLSGELNSLDESTEEFIFQIGPTVNSIGTFSGSTGSGTAFWNPTYELEPFSPPPNRKSREDYSAKLKKHNSSLANSYDEVWQIYLGTSSDPHRAALFEMRTVFDNFFVWIGPDEEVRNSKYWHSKDGEKPNQIWHSERLAFALEKNVKDSNRRTMLEAQSNQITVLYKAANKAHNRGSLNEDQASRTLMAMDSFLIDWIDSLS
ncbi:MAG: hypothetical protein Q7J07_10275 [Pelolinea sp.]|nr:hypothetical protein [Pelolinea sp.]